MSGNQTSGDLVNFHPHVHVLAADGVFRPDGTFVSLPPVPEDLLRQGFRRAVFEVEPWLAPYLAYDNAPAPGAAQSAVASMVNLTSD